MNRDRPTLLGGARGACVAIECSAVHRLVFDPRDDATCSSPTGGFVKGTTCAAVVSAGTFALVATFLSACTDTTSTSTRRRNAGNVTSPSTSEDTHKLSALGLGYQQVAPAGVSRPADCGARCSLQ
jgi:hypothetical protein